MPDGGGGVGGTVIINGQNPHLWFTIDIVGLAGIDPTYWVKMRRLGIFQTPIFWEKRGKFKDFTPGFLSCFKLSAISVSSIKLTADFSTRMVPKYDCTVPSPGLNAT